MKYFNLQIIYNFTLKNRAEEKVILAKFQKAGKALEELPYFECTETKRQSVAEVFKAMSL